MNHSIVSANQTTPWRLRRYGRRMWENRWFYLMILPGFLTVLIFHYFPIYGIQVAFRKFSMRKGISGSPWMGFYYFERFFKNPNFALIIGNTLKISVLKLVIGEIAQITLALLFNEIVNKRYQKVVQTVSYLPHFVSWIVVAAIMQDLLSPTRGAINMIINWFGGESIYFLGDKNYFVGTLIVSSIWKNVGWGTVVYIAAISSIDQEQYESAHMDGASRFQVARYITLPSIAGTIVVMLTLALGGLLSAGFDQVFNLYSPSVYPVADIIDTYVYRLAFIDTDYSYSAAIGLFKNVIGSIMVLGTNYIVRVMSKGEKGLW